MKANFGLLPPLPKRKMGKPERSRLYAQRAGEEFERWQAETSKS
jgi:folate-dependent tRNA-U54 methylase TrmFO/GidA